MRNFAISFFLLVGLANPSSAGIFGNYFAKRENVKYLAKRAYSEDFIQLSPAVGLDFMFSFLDRQGQSFSKEERAELNSKSKKLARTELREHYKKFKKMLDAELSFGETQSVVANFRNPLMDRYRSDVELKVLTKVDKALDVAMTGGRLDISEDYSAAERVLLDCQGAKKTQAVNVMVAGAGVSFNAQKFGRYFNHILIKYARAAFTSDELQEVVGMMQQDSMKKYTKIFGQTSS